jgi:hypothetical protein
MSHQSKSKANKYVIEEEEEDSRMERPTPFTSFGTMFEFRQDNIRNVKRFLRNKKIEKIGDHAEVVPTTGEVSEESSEEEKAPNASGGADK